jgi:hypothetical protein
MRNYKERSKNWGRSIHRRPLQVKNPQTRRYRRHRRGSRLFDRNLGVSSGDIKCIPKTEEKYISFTKEIEVDEFKGKDGKKRKVKREMRFLDSFKFMASSLDKRVKGLDKDDFRNLDLMSKCYTKEQKELLKQKGVCPYEYMDGFDKLGEAHFRQRANSSAS